MLPPSALFTVDSFPLDLLRPYPQTGKFCQGKHSSLFGSFVSYEERSIITLDTIKLFTAVIITFVWLYARVFDTLSHFQPNKIFVVKAKRMLGLPTYIRLYRKYFK